LRPASVYVHVPYCASRCGYCDFNTYVAGDKSAWAPAAVAEVQLMRRTLGPRADRPRSVFFGGGTPTLLPVADLARVLRAIDPAPGAEVTVEANPETVDGARFIELLEAGFIRVSIGMQSARAHVLASLERRHTPGRAVAAAREAREAGFEHVSLDLIYGAPGETDDDWRASLEEALSAGPDHLSAYGLILEPGTRMARRFTDLDEDAQARRYETAERMLADAGLRWYELCSWASSDSAHCRHNLGYWRGHDWWGIGPGAHSHVDGVRWWNLKRPVAWSRRLHEGLSPAAGEERLSAEQRRLERIMLGLRLAEGLPAATLTDRGLRAAARARRDGLLQRAGDRVVLTLRGRLLADLVVRAISQ
jgi:putative oxygen-independent coproporphyrinogen III oxidase